MKKVNAIYAWMQRHVTEYVDMSTGEVNCTTLAESACSIFNGYVGDNIPEEYFELAFEVNKEWEINRNG